MSRIRRAGAVLAVAAGLVAVHAAPASAAGGYWSGGPFPCSGLVSTCSISYMSHSVSSNTSNCIGTYGSYTACRVYVSCDATVGGTLGVNGTMTCDGGDPSVDSCQALLGGQCGMSASWLPVVQAVNTCQPYTISVTVSAVGGARTESHTIGVCVGFTGPYNW